MTHKPIELLGFSHICIAVSDAEVSLRFYRDLLGLEVVFDLELEAGHLTVPTIARGLLSAFVPVFERQIR
jgi:glyoxylase I family protein